MYEIFSKISSLFTQPLLNIWESTVGVPLLSAFLLGLVGAMVPCQFTGNLSAITIYGNNSLQKGIAWKEIIYFVMGKIIAFTGLGLVIWLLGTEVKSTLTIFFPWIRKAFGPMLILIGLYMLGSIKIRKIFKIGNIPDRLIKKRKTGAFFLGVSFSLGFCPTMFVLFFITLMPMSLTVPYGPVLPSVFAIGTSLPLLIAIFILWYFKLSGKFLKKKSRKLGIIVQRVAGAFILIIGILDTFTYWGI